MSSDKLVIIGIYDQDHLKNHNISRHLFKVQENQLKKID